LFLELGRSDPRLRQATDCWRGLWTSTMGVSALTVIVSETTPTRKSRVDAEYAPA
jgi:hypothetical protein